MQGALPLVLALFYALALFGFAAWAERHGQHPRNQRLRPFAYALALAVYCTSWTYYGAVGSVVADGWSYLPIYLGPVLLFLFGQTFLRRMVDAVKADGASSISEFIGGRFGRSQGVAALVTLLALMGSVPYLALQLRSLGSSYARMSGSSSPDLAMAVAAIGLALFAMVYGTRRYEAAGRNDAVLFAVGFESLVKLGALLLAGVLALVLLHNVGAEQSRASMALLAVNFAPTNVGMDFFVIILLSMAAILCLPRQFYVTAILADSSNEIARARWPFIAYIVATALVVLPIGAAGLAVLPFDTPPDIYVLELPLAQGLSFTALLIFLGGFSAATAMVLVEIIALSTMVSNDLVAPLLLRSDRFRGEGDLGRALLLVRRLAMAAIMLAALGWALGIAERESLASIGLVAFAAMAQFTPALVLAVLGSNRDATAAKAGLITGLLIWAYTLALPQVAGAQWMAMMRGSLIDPNGLLGIDGLSPLSHGALWSLGANLAVFALVTMRRVQARALPGLLRDAQIGPVAVSNIADLKAMVARFVGPEVTAAAFAGIDENARVDRAHSRQAERMIASVVGLPSARAFMRSALYGSNLTHEEVARILDDTGQSLRFSKGLLAATLENIDPGVSVVDRDLNVVAWNNRYLELFAYPDGMVRVGAPVADLIRYNAMRGECGPGEIESHVERRLGHMRRGLAHSFERTRPDGRVLKTVGGPMPSGGYVMCFTDVTAEAQALAALERARAELESRVAERTSELQAANSALAHADAEKTRFLAAASHDLLQPLHAAWLFSAALSRDVAPAQQSILARLDRSIEAADTLLRALLDISKLDAGGVSAQVRPVRLRPLLVELAETMAPLAREKGLDLRIGNLDASVDTDPGLLRSIIQNFLSNAIRYTDSGGVLIGVRRRGSHARVDVIDTGPGIPADKTALIFREFERLPDAAEGGIGLGLAIVERTARVLGARISLRSREGRGSRFSVSLPLAAMSAPDDYPAMPVPAYATGSSAAQRFLIVDDDPANCDALQSYLCGMGRAVQAYTDPQATIDAGEAFDVALIDFNLGSGMDGLDVIAALRSAHPQARYALVTAARSHDYAARAAAMQIDVLNKPVAAAELEQWLAATYTNLQ